MNIGNNCELRTDLVIGGRIILKWNSKREDVEMLTGFKWLRMGSNGCLQ
jgi:hypothetical protein